MPFETPLDSVGRLFNVTCCLLGSRLAYCWASGHRNWALSTSIQILPWIAMLPACYLANMWYWCKTGGRECTQNHRPAKAPYMWVPTQCLPHIRELQRRGNFRQASTYCRWPENDHNPKISRSVQLIFYLCLLAGGRWRPTTRTSWTRCEQFLSYSHILQGKQFLVVNHLESYGAAKHLMIPNHPYQKGYQ